MKVDTDKILSIDSLRIGYSSGKRKKILLPPLFGGADKGELIAIIGRNGIGKSTLLKTLAGLQGAIEGRIILSGREINDYSGSELACISSFISTDIIRVNNMRVYDLVSLGRFPHTNWLGSVNENDFKIIEDAMEKASVSVFRNRFISELSDGERQKAMIARMLAQDTPIMLMDEPTAFLDIGSKFELMHLLYQLSHKAGKTVIFTTHDLQLAISNSDKIWLIHDHGIREGAPEDLMIEGAFDHLFDSSPVEFNPENGTFSFREEKKSALYIEGDGLLKYWTEEAVRRAGHSVSGKKTVPYIRINTVDQSKWQVILPESEVDFISVYELMKYLLKNSI